MSDVAVTWTVALTWLGASLAFSALLGLSVLFGELLVASFGRPRRFLWASALVLAVIWPVAGWFMVPRVAPQWVVHPYEPPAATMDVGPSAVIMPAVDRAWTASSLPPVATVATLWGVLSLVMAGFVLRGALVLYRAQRAARREVLLGETVLRTQHVGPAVIGVGRASLLMPDWLWELDERLQRLVLHHELEHRRAGDPWLVWGGVLATLITPWNPVIWWMMHRMRLAMEIDCDARTLKAHPDAGSQYPRLLLLIAHLRQRPQYTPHLAPLIIPSASQLSRRMRAMTSPVPLKSPMAKLAVAAITFGLLNAACSRQIAGNLAGPAVPVVMESVPGEGVSVAPSDSVTSAAAKDSVYFDFQVERQAIALPPGFGPRFAEVLGTLKVDGDVLMQFVVEPGGTVRKESIKVLQSPHPELSNAVVVGLSELRFQPAMRGGRPVAQLVQQRSSFGVGKPVSTQQSESKGRAAGGERKTDTTPTPASTDRVLFDFEVDTPAMFAPGSSGPAYPAEARARGLNGEVLAQFVVDVDGTVVPGSIRVVRSSDSLFSAAVEQFLPSARFTPAKNGGQPVRQLVQQPFGFETRKD
ncbi:M56 family metallopeptidase [Gemmatimonas sp. UBA7669]|uniref:M56 family metallopeptidase n=1 Tax=Gemmatimonas sp. UBA7669 TaxID=1946568 RepID=UPI0025B89254|nr:M56 family metallopeptidase [Gemmatimonas sp. UBA7669]